MNKYVKFPLVLGTVALVSGALLATTYQLTKEKIEQGVIDRQTSAINDLFTKIDSKELLEVPSDFASKGVKSIVKVESNGKKYNCYTIAFKDSIGGDESSVIIVLDSNAKVYGVKFVTAGDSYAAKYNNDTYLATVIKNNTFDAIGGATFTGNDLNAVLKIARDCMSGKEKEPIDELFGGNISSKVTINKPTDADNKINSIQKVVSRNKTYYVYDVTFNDTLDEDLTNILYALNGDGSLYKLKVVKGDGYASSYDLVSDLDSVSDATYTKADISDHYQMVKDCHKSLLLNEIFVDGITSKEVVTKPNTADSAINSIEKVISNGNTYYVYDVTFNDTLDEDKINALYALNENGSLYKINIVLGDSYAFSYDLVSDLDSVSDATYTKADLNDYYDVVKACNDSIVEVE